MLTTPDGTSLAYGNMADYGKQHPSYVQQDVHTRVGNSAAKQLDTSEDVVYGKVVSYERAQWFRTDFDFTDVRDAQCSVRTVGRH